jgi:cytoskeleton protein RodZ
MADEPGGEPRRKAGCGVGAQLRTARERAGLTIGQAAQKLGVDAAVLGALETERFEALGAPIYVKSYLQRYADLLGEPAVPLQERLAARVAMTQPDLTRAPRVSPPRAGIVGRLLTGLGVLGMVGLVWWGWSHRHQRVAVPVISGLVSARPVPAAGAVGAPPRAGAEKAHRGTRGSRAAAPATPAIARIGLRFPAASWVAVTDGAGRSLYRGMVAAGTTRSFEGRAPLHVVLGYASGVAVRIDGRAASIGAYVGRDHAVSFDITAGGRVLPAPLRAGG